MQFADGSARVAGASQGIAPLMVLNPPGGLDVQTLAGLRFELPALDQGIGCHPHLADGPLRIFPPATADRLLPETGN